MSEYVFGLDVNIWRRYEHMGITLRLKFLAVWNFFKFRKHQGSENSWTQSHCTCNRKATTDGSCHNMTSKEIVP